MPWGFVVRRSNLEERRYVFSMLDYFLSETVVLIKRYSFCKGMVLIFCEMT